MPASTQASGTRVPFTQGTGRPRGWLLRGPSAAPTWEKFRRGTFQKTPQQLPPKPPAQRTAPEPPGLPLGATEWKWRKPNPIFSQIWGKKTKNVLDKPTKIVKLWEKGNFKNMIRLQRCDSRHCDTTGPTASNQPALCAQVPGLRKSTRPAPGQGKCQHISGRVPPPLPKPQRPCPWTAAPSSHCPEPGWAGLGWGSGSGWIPGTAQGPG